MLIDNALDFVKATVFDDEEYIKTNIIRSANFVKNTCYKDNIIIVLHSAANNKLKASLLELINYSE